MEIAIVIIVALIIAISYVVNYLKFRTEQIMYSGKGCGCGMAIIVLVIIVLFSIFAISYQTGLCQQNITKEFFMKRFIRLSVQRITVIGTFYPRINYKEQQNERISF